MNPKPHRKRITQRDVANAVGCSQNTVALALPSRRYRSALIGIAVHSVQSVVLCALVLPIVLRG